jgi:hypothetical protein
MVSSVRITSEINFLLLEALNIIESDAFNPHENLPLENKNNK